MRTAKLKNNINTSRDEGRISGKKITIEKEFSVNEILDIKYDKFTIALTNFIIRRQDFLEEKNGDKKVYYGHVGFFGYYVAEDEIAKWLD